MENIVETAVSFRQLLVEFVTLAVRFSKENQKSNLSGKEEAFIVIIKLLL